MALGPRSFLAGALTFAMALAGCPGGGGGGPGGGDDGGAGQGGALVVGVHADELGGLVGSFRVLVKQDGRTVRDETIPASPGLVAGRELPLEGPAGALVEVSAEALPIGGGAPLVTRTASSRLVPVSEGKKLLRVRIESRCVVIPAANDLPPAGVVCPASETCSGGACIRPAVDPTALEDYEATWAAAAPDICRPARRGPPEILLGTGQTDYASLAEGQLLQLEKGPQGGHHVWIAVRMRNLRQAGSTTTITSRLVGDPGPVPPAAYVFTYERDEGGYCKVWGLRYQVDAGEVDLANAYRRFLGKQLEVTVEVKDSTGATARATKTIALGDKLLCPDGTTACNTP